MKLVESSSIDKAAEFCILVFYSSNLKAQTTAVNNELEQVSRHSPWLGDGLLHLLQHLID